MLNPYKCGPGKEACNWTESLGARRWGRQNLQSWGSAWERTNDLHLNLESRGCYYCFSGLRLELLFCLLRKLPWEVDEYSQMLYKPKRDLNFSWTIYIFAFCLHHLAFHLPIMASWKLFGWEKHFYSVLSLCFLVLYATKRSSFISMSKRKSMLKLGSRFLQFLESLCSVQCNNLVFDRGRTCWYTYVKWNKVQMRYGCKWTDCYRAKHGCEQVSWRELNCLGTHSLILKKHSWKRPYSWKEVIWVRVEVQTSVQGDCVKFINASPNKFTAVNSCL